MLNRRLRPRFSLRSIFAIVTIAGTVSAFFSYLYRQDHLEVLAVRTATRLHGTVEWEKQHRFSLLPGARRCTKVAFMQCELAGEDLSFLADLPELRDLYIAGSNVTDTQMRWIGGVRSLESLSMAESLITDAGLASLGNCSRLKHLLFAKTAVKGTSFQTLCRLPMLERVNADACPLNDDAFTWLGKCKRLRVLVASGGELSITERGVRGLCCAQGLEEVHLVANVTPEVLEPLFELPRLKHLVISGGDKSLEKWYRMTDDVWELGWPQSKAKVTLDSDGALHVNWPQRRVGHAHTQEK